MDLATLVGLIGGLAVIFLAIVVGGSPVLFINIPSILIVVVGTVFVVAMKFSLTKFKNAISVALKAFFFKLDNPKDVITEIIEIAKIVRKEGPLALESREIPNAFLARGIRLLVDSADPKAIQTILSRERSSTYSRHEEGQRIFKGVDTVAPAMGMIGTLVGLVQMLSNMSDPKSIGPAMAVALLTTLYGAILSNVVAAPIADKLAMRAEEEDALQALIIDAIMGMASGYNPAIIEETLASYLSAKDKPKQSDAA